MPTFPFNQTDVENLYNQNILNVTQIDSKLDLVRIDINKLVDIMNQTTSSVQTQTYGNTDFLTAQSNYYSFLDGLVNNGYIILNTQLICSPRPQSVQLENDWIAVAVIMPKV